MAAQCMTRAICGGDDTTCLDCFGTPNGPATYDACDICGGDGTSCLDCRGVAFGSSKYDQCDVCDVCDGDSTLCLDCKDVPFGTSVYDICGVCEGDGTSCTCAEVGGCPIEEVDYALLSWSSTAVEHKLDGTLDLLRGIKDELCDYDVGSGRLSDEISAYLDTALEFKDVIDNYAYVTLYTKGEVDDYNEALAQATP